ncbi:MAG: DNA-3-methyladenine glycosylase [Myxococcota bacterium]
MLPPEFFDRGPRTVARALLGTVLRRRYKKHWLSVRIVETEAYEKREKGSHASLGRTPSREALFMAPGTIYMYYSRAGDSLNVSCRGEGNAVLIKAGAPYIDGRSPRSTLRVMHRLNPRRDGGARDELRLCSGQTLLCKALDLRVKEWTGKRFTRAFHIEDVGDRPSEVLRRPRLGIPEGRDEHLPWRYIDGRFRAQTTLPRSV